MACVNVQGLERLSKLDVLDLHNNRITSMHGLGEGMLLGVIVGLCSRLDRATYAECQISEHFYLPELFERLAVRSAASTRLPDCVIQSQISSPRLPEAI